MFQVHSMTRQYVFLSPEYHGPFIIQESLRKLKSELSLTRILSSHNKRNFVLNLETLQFYYSPEKVSQITDCTLIPLENILRVQVDKSLQENHHSCEFGITIVLKKKEYRLSSSSIESIERLLRAFGHLINVETNKPLFDWNSYKGESRNSTQHLNQTENEIMEVPKIIQPSKEDRTIIETLQNSGNGAQIFQKVETKFENPIFQIEEEIDELQKEHQEGRQNSSCSANNNADVSNEGIPEIDPTRVQVRRKDNLKNTENSWSHGEDQGEKNYIKEKLEINIKIQFPSEDRRIVRPNLEVIKKDETKSENEHCLLTDLSRTNQESTLEKVIALGAKRLIRKQSVGPRTRVREEVSDFAGLSVVGLTQNREENENGRTADANIERRCKKNKDYRRKLLSTQLKDVPTSFLQDTTSSPLREVDSNKKIEEKENNKAVNQEDWDEEMFKDGSFPPRRIVKESTVNKNESFLPRPNVHNDWDDELDI